MFNSKVFWLFLIIDYFLVLLQLNHSKFLIKNYKVFSLNWQIFFPILLKKIKKLLKKKIKKLKKKKVFYGGGLEGFKALAC
jgi:hypothetical protein